MVETAAPERPVVRVMDDDRMAAWQILACIARPHSPKRTASAGELMQQWYWARRRHLRVNYTPAELAIAIPDKDRINSKLPALAKDISAGLQAGKWLKLKWASESDGIITQASGASFREQGAREWNAAPEHKRLICSGDIAATTSREDNSATAKQRIWTRRRPVAHMALAVREQVREHYTDGLHELEALVFDPQWVAGALERAERYADAAVRHKILEPGESWRFIR
jgi:hypothetical protein|tara:strand:+ start:1376 stop:2053 length:678 start_codon:yes stop_codon:yes gene_type:complete